MSQRFAAGALCLALGAAGYFFAQSRLPDAQSVRRAAAAYGTLDFDAAHIGYRLFPSPTLILHQASLQTHDGASFSADTLRLGLSWASLLGSPNVERAEWYGGRLSLPDLENAAARTPSLRRIIAHNTEADIGGFRQHILFADARSDNGVWRGRASTRIAARPNLTLDAEGEWDAAAQSGMFSAQGIEGKTRGGIAFDLSQNGGIWHIGHARWHIEDGKGSAQGRIDDISSDGAAHRIARISAAGSANGARMTLEASAIRIDGEGGSGQFRLSASEKSVEAALSGSLNFHKNDWRGDGWTLIARRSGADGGADYSAVLHVDAQGRGLEDIAARASGMLDGRAISGSLKRRGGHTEAAIDADAAALPEHLSTANGNLWAHFPENETLRLGWRVKDFQAASLRLKNFTGVLRADGSSAIIEKADAIAAGGTASLSGSLYRSGLWTLEGAFHRVNIGGLLDDAGGRASGNVRLEGGRGRLDGNISLHIANGYWNGTPLPRWNANADDERRTLAFERLDAQISIRDGAVASSPFSMKSAGFSADGDGTADIAARTLDYRAAIRPNAAAEPLLPLRISGSWDHPEASIDFRQLDLGANSPKQRKNLIERTLRRQWHYFNRAREGR